jgi:anti-sigma B factor antagonist
MLNINKTITNGKAVFTLEGRLDTNTSVELDAALSPVLDTINELVFDLSALEYISSAGLRVLLATHKSLSKKGGMKVTNVNEMIMEIFEVTGFSDILTIE